jgi:aminoglycoside 6'-N-acetyltransferase
MQDEPDIGFRSLRSDRLILRRFSIDDIESFVAYRSEPDVARYQSWDVPFTWAQAQAFLDAQAATDPDTPGEWFQLAVVEASSGALIGDVAALADGADPRLAKIGFTLATAAQGKGYATEAATRLVDYLFVTRHKHRVAADCDARNAPSIAVLERLGMRREARHRQSAWWKGEWTDELVYATLADEWTINSRDRLRTLENRPAANHRKVVSMTESNLSELRERAEKGDGEAADELIELATERGDLDELRRLADRGNATATDQLIELATELGDLDELRRLADQGNKTAAEQLMELTAE